MNKPASTSGNWQWRLLPDQLGNLEADVLKQMAILYGRAKPVEMRRATDHVKAASPREVSDEGTAMKWT
jgi:hypothetical protein